MPATIEQIRAIRTRYDETLQRMGSKSVLGFRIENHPLLWNLIALSAHRADPAKVADMVLATLSAPHALYVNNTVLLGMSKYPDDYGSNEFELWMTCNTAPTASSPQLLKEYLDQRIGTPATYALVLALVLRCVGAVGALRLEYVEDNLDIDAGDRKIAHAWVRIVGTDEVIDLFSRATGRPSKSTDVNGIVKSMNF